MTFCIHLQVGAESRVIGGACKGKNGLRVFMKRCIRWWLIQHPSYVKLHLTQAGGSLKRISKSFLCRVWLLKVTLNEKSSERQLSLDDDFHINSLSFSLSASIQCTMKSDSVLVVQVLLFMFQCS